MRSRQITASLAVAVIAALAAAPAASAKAKDFSFGVSSGDVSSSSAILWAKADKSGTTYLQLTEHGGFGPCDADHAAAKVKATNKHDNTVSAPIRRLEPATDYEYRYCTDSGGRSDTGTFTTAPDANKNATIHFALTGDQDARPAPGGATPYWNNFEVWSQILKQRNDFNVLLGDTIYSDTEVPGYTLADVATTVKQKWEAYKTNLGEKPWIKARGSAAYYAHFDDHEFIDNFSHFEDSFAYSNNGVALGATNIDGNTIYKRGLQAFEDYNPTTYSKRTGIYRSVRWGKNLEVFFLDERSFRSAASDYQGTCDNPPGSGNADLAPTAPQGTRNVFSALNPALANPPPPGCVASINDPNRTMLGAPQLKKFEQAIKTSSATFKVIFNEVPIQQYYALPYDRWEGYAAERSALLHYLQDKVKNAVFMTTDVHANFVNDARFNTLGDAGVQNSGIFDITTGPVATRSYAGEINDTLGTPSGGSLIHDLFLKPQPPSGVGMQCAALDQFSYAEVTVSKQQLQVELLDQNGAPVSDTGDISTPGPSCASIVIRKQ